MRIPRQSSELESAARNVRLVVTDVDGVHTADKVTIFGVPDEGKKLVFDLHLAGKAVRLVPFDESGNGQEHYLASADDGRIEGYQFFTGDGIGVIECLRNDIPVYFMTGRNSPAVRRRAKDLGVEGRFGVKDKVAELEGILSSRGLAWKDVLFIGNDVQDLSLLRRAGFSAAPADAVSEVLNEVMYVADRRGGEGAVREVLQFVLTAKGLWDQIVHRARTLG